MLFSHASQVALRAALFLAHQPRGKRCPVREIAQETCLPRPYLAKIIQQLMTAGLVRAHRGPHGGVELGRAPEQICLQDVVRAMDGPVPAAECALGLRACSQRTPCPLHRQWMRIQAETQSLLESTTLAWLLRQMNSSRALSREFGAAGQGGRDGVSN